jgi:hypothetical protein
LPIEIYIAIIFNTHRPNTQAVSLFQNKKMTKKLFYLLATVFALNLNAQNPGLVISEVLVNPAGTDSCKEYVELLAVQNINFSVTPYTIIVNNNGTANANGWVAGGTLSYAFAINSGSVAAGSVVYVGGSCMTPTTGQLRTLNVKYVNGDWNIGSPNAAGVFGNGGGNADGVAVFNLPISSITSSTVPTDALFFGTGVGTSSVNAGADGYQLPINDLYSGGKLIGTSFLAPDPGSDIIITSTGIYDMAAATWSVNRIVSTGTITSEAVSSISISTSGTVSPTTISFFSNDTTVNESSATANIFMRITAASTASSSISVYATAFSNASATDYTLGATTFTFPANAAVNSTAALTFSINNDATIESAEYIILRFFNPQNASIGANSQFAFYIADNDKVIPAPSNALALNLLSSFSNGTSGSNSAEIVAHDPTTQRLYIANSIGGKLDIINFVNPSSPSLLLSIPITTYGNINSVAVRNGTLALAIENSTNPQDSGKVVFLNQNGGFISQVKVGMMPDMITFNQAGTRVITANEGEPNATYTNDPDGSVSIINVSGGIANVTQSNVAHVTFTVYNGQETSLRAQGIRIFGLNASASKDFEPEYVSVSKDDTKAWVTLQENNAVVEINLTTNAITSIRALGSKDHSLLNNGYDVSNVTKGINISNFPIKGLYMPDAIASYTVGGINYLVTANEGDSRAYTGFNEEVRIASAVLDPIKFPFAAQMRNNSVLGRLNITNKLGDTDNDGDLDTLFSYGSRSFSIWNATNGQLVYDSKDDMELITATNSYSVLFNASNSNNTRKDRSDDKGPEPEGVTIGTIGANTYAFIAIERIGGVMVYDITNPNAPVFVTYANNRSLPSGGPDNGAEGVIFIPQSQSPNGQHIVISANEVSSTLSIWGIAGCTTPLSSSLSVSGSTSAACSNNPPVLSVVSNTAVTYLWSVNGTTISGATSNTYAPIISGNYSVAINGGTNCATSSILQSLTVNPTPTLTLAGSNSICLGASVTQTISGAATYSWSSGATTSVVTLTPSGTTVYTVSGTSSNSCNATATTAIVVNAVPQLTLSSNATTICSGQSVSVTTSGASSYSWNTGAVTSSLSVSPLTNTVYVVSGTNTLNCSSTANLTVSVNASPVLTLSGGTVICAGSSISQTVNGASTYSWSSGSTASVVNLSPVVTTIYTVTGNSANSCSASIIRTVLVNQLPVLVFTPPVITICNGQSALATVSGANTYSWSNGNQTNTLNIASTSNTVFVVLGTSAANCSSTNTLVVNAISLPVLLISGNASVCAGSAISQTVSGGVSYVWNNGTTNSILTVTPSTTTSYTTIGTAANGCTASIAKTITVVPVPVLLVTPTSSLICNGESSSITVSGANSYSWSTGSTNTLITVNPTMTTNYTVTGLSANSCSSGAQITQSVSACLALNNYESKESDVTIYPNPTHSEVFVGFENSTYTNLRIVNSIGQEVFYQTNYNSGQSINIRDLSKGIYFVYVTGINIQSIKKLIIE